MTNLSQQAQLKRDINKARTIHAISPQSSLYIPIIDPPSRLPPTVHLDASSEWQTSALISSAMESALLPTRLRPYHDFEGSLAADDGTHRIFELQSRIMPESENQDGAKGSTGTECSSATGSKVRREFDLDFTYDEASNDQTHIYNQVQVWRGLENEQKEAPQDIGLIRRQQYQNSEPMCQR